jgi:hypothetical protein
MEVREQTQAHSGSAKVKGIPGTQWIAWVSSRAGLGVMKKTKYSFKAVK